MVLGLKKLLIDHVFYPWFAGNTYVLGCTSLLMQINKLSMMRGTTHVLVPLLHHHRRRRHRHHQHHHHRFLIWFGELGFVGMVLSSINCTSASSVSITTKRKFKEELTLLENRSLVPGGNPRLIPVLRPVPPGRY